MTSRYVRVGGLALQIGECLGVGIYFALRGFQLRIGIGDLLLEFTRPLLFFKKSYLKVILLLHFRTMVFEQIMHRLFFIDLQQLSSILFNFHHLGHLLDNSEKNAVQRQTESDSREMLPAALLMYPS